MHIVACAMPPLLLLVMPVAAPLALCQPVSRAAGLTCFTVPSCHASSFLKAAVCFRNCASVGTARTCGFLCLGAGSKRLQLILRLARCWQIGKYSLLVSVE